jgi:tetratricopeptide (TPR) repeat protein
MGAAMINLAISLAAGLATALLIRLGGFGFLAGGVPGAVVAIAIYIVLARRTFMKLQQVVQQVQVELSSMTANKKEQIAKGEKAVKLLEAVLPLGRWQFMLESEIHGQIGMIKYLFKDFDGAMASFVKTSARNYFARAMQAAIFFQKKDFVAMEKAFEDAVNHGKKESLMWAAYAWCLTQNKESEKAIKVLARGVENNPSDEKLKKALTALQNDKRLKMSAWEPMWWQLGLEAPPMQQPQFMGGANRRRMMRGR